jgi:hypothetical protein
MRVDISDNHRHTRPLELVQSYDGYRSRSRLAAFAVSPVWPSEIYESRNLDSRSYNVAGAKNCAPARKLKAQIAY